MPMKNRVFLFCSVLLLLPAIRPARHGKDILLTLISSTPRPGEWSAPLASSFKRNISALTIEPQLLPGIVWDWADGLHAQIDSASGLTHGNEATLAVALGVTQPRGSVQEIAL